jgi:hypothetical protein
VREIYLISFSDEQWKAVMTAARSLPVSMRRQFLQLIAEQLKLRDCDIQEADHTSVAAG